MRAIRTWLLRLVSFLGGERYDRDLDAELHIPFTALLLCAMALCGSVLWALAQTDNGATIRSQTIDTLVPVLVLDKNSALKFHHMEPDDWRNQVVASGYKMWQSIAITNLRKADFKLYEDGEEQEIESVTPENKDSNQYLANNFDRYWQAVGVGGGVWSIPGWVPQGSGVTSTFANSERIYQPIFGSSGDQSSLYTPGQRTIPLNASGLEAPPMFVDLPPLAWYMIAYTRPISPPGSCHRITVKVDRSDSLIYSRSEYCDASDSAADALAGTRLGDQLKADLSSKKQSALPLTITAIPVFTAAGANPIRLFIDARSDAASINCNSFMGGSGIIGLVYSKDGTVAERFSDGLFYAPGENSMYWDTEWFTPASWPEKMACSDVFYEPTRYETQLELPPGAYQLQVALWNGRKFGRAEIPLMVDPYDPTKLVIGGLALVGRSREVGPNWTVLPRSLSSRYPPLIANGIEITPAADAHFKKDGPIRFYLQLYEPHETGAQQPTVLVHVQVREARTGRVVERLQPMNAAPFVTLGSPVIPIASAIDIAKLGEGSYELQAQANDSTGAVTPWQSAYFTVEK